MQTVRIRQILIIAGIVSLFISYLGIWIRLINDPAERTGSDFIAFYSAGRVAQNEGAANVYNPQLLQEIQQGEVGFPLVPGQVLLYNHLPFLIPLLQIIVSASYVGSFYRWIFLLIAIYIAAITILSGALKQAGIDRNSIVLTAIGAFLFLPVFFSLMNGQDTALLFLGTAIWMYGLLSGKETLAGLGLSLTTVRPQIALFLAIPMLFRYIKVFWSFLVGSGFLAILSVLILGINGTREYINILLLSSGGEWYGMKENAMYNLIGLLTRAAPQVEASVIRTFAWSVYGIAIIGLCILWSKKQNSTEDLIGLTVTLALFVAPHLHLHDLALLLIPIYGVIRASRETPNLKTLTAIILPIAISLLFLISNISPYLQYTVPYLMMLMLAVFPFYQKSKILATTAHQS
ncbi:MAG TPA: glycosyltransferase 87 family protein [Anaerolineales bacterium]|nr:glycosyltransferase 87 family protein [Anaerolineales bacterium]